MINEDSARDRAIGHLVEKQIRNWELDQSQKSVEFPPQKGEVFDFISLSHSAGLPTTELASRLGERLGWPVFDRKILQTMAGDDKHRERIYQSMDERDLSWLDETVLRLADEGFAWNDYFQNLVKTVLSITRRRSVIFVGHATDLILPRDCGLRVRVVASGAFCVQALARERGIPADQAAKEIAEFEHERTRFVRHHFHIDAHEPARQDLIVNLERISTDGAVGLILEALHARGADG